MMNLEEEEATITFPEPDIISIEVLEYHNCKFISHYVQKEASSCEIASSCSGWHKMPKTTKCCL